MDQNIIALLDTSTQNQRRIACGRRHKQTGRFGKRPAGRHGLQLGLCGDDLGGIGALAGTENAVTDGKPRLEDGAGAGRGQHDTRKLGTGDPWEG